MIAELIKAYRGTWQAALAAPLFVLLPVLIEGGQHFLEWKIGMFSDDAGFAAAGASSLRGVIATAKVGTVLTIALSVGRRLYSEGSIAQAIRPGPRSLHAILLWGAALAVLAMSVLIWGGWLADRAEGLGGADMRIVGQLSPVLAFALVLAPFEWVAIRGIGRAIGDECLTRARIRKPPPWLPLLLIAGMGAPFVLHYALNYSTVGQPAASASLALAVDSLLVGGMAVLLGNLLWATYRLSVEEVPAV